MKRGHNLKAWVDTASDGAVFIDTVLLEGLIKIEVIRSTAGLWRLLPSYYRPIPVLNIYDSIIKLLHKIYSTLMIFLGTTLQLEGFKARIFQISEPVLK